MTFQSLSFAAFVAAAAGLFWLAPPRFKRQVLLAASYVFYASWSVPYTGLLLAVTALVYTAALRIEASQEESAKRRIMAATVVMLLGVLASFKYFGDVRPFFAQTGWGGGRLAALQLAAPLGISYYVFKLTGYVVDVYWETMPAERSLVAVASYAAFFPQMVCGPIQRAGDFLTQTRTIVNPSADMVTSGLRLVLFGFFKKLVVADQIGTVIDPFFDQPGHQVPAELLVALYLFPIQLYADFSGITDIAIGVGRLFGVESPPNFDSPLYAPNITDFWRRWHMSLTSWLRDYVFMPLRHATRALGDAGLVVSIMANMVAIGLWHGARSSYLAFGIINGVYMSVSALTLKARNRWFGAHPAWARLRRFGAPVVLFHLVVIAFAFFRLPTASKAAFALIAALPALLQPAAVGHAVGAKTARLAVAMLGVVAMEVVHYARRAHLMDRWFYRRPIWVRWGVYYAAGLAIALLGVYTTTTFIYAQF